MSDFPLAPSYTVLFDALQKAKSSVNPAETHGLICGLICTTSQPLDQNWLSLILGVKNRRNSLSHRLLQELYDASHHQLQEFSFEFTLLLPDDEAELSTRTEALGLWCQGFLTALKQSEIALEHRPPGDITDALNDLIEIAQVSYDDIQAGEESELAYLELVEYVRLVVLMLHNEFQTHQ